MKNVPSSPPPPAPPAPPPSPPSPFWITNGLTVDEAAFPPKRHFFRDTSSQDFHCAVVRG